jgi:hypothetical protein
MARRKAVEEIEVPVTRFIPVEKIKLERDFNSRKDSGFDKESLAELGLNLYRNGQLQPGRVRALTGKQEGNFALEIGERRLRAIRQWNTEHPGDAPLQFYAIVVPAVVLEGTPEEQEVIKEASLIARLVANLSENMLRRDLDVFEKADRLSLMHIEHGMTVKELNLATGLDRATIEMYLKVADSEKLPTDIRDHLKGANVGLSTAAMIADVKPTEDPDDLDKALELKQKLIKDCEASGAITRERVAKARREMANSGEAVNARVKAVGLVELRGDVQQMLDSYNVEDVEAGGVSHAQAMFFVMLKKYMEGRLKFDTFCTKLDKALVPQEPPKKKVAKKRAVKKVVDATDAAEATAG